MVPLGHLLGASPAARQLGDAAGDLVGSFLGLPAGEDEIGCEREARGVAADVGAGGAGVLGELRDLRGAELPGVDGVSLTRGETQEGAAAVEPHDDGRVGLLDGPGGEGGAPFEAIVLAGELRLLLRPEGLEDADAFLQLLDASEEVEHLEAVGLEVGVLVGGADAEHGASPGERIDGGDLLGELKGVVEGHARDVGAQPHVPRLRRYPAEIAPGIGLVEGGVVDNVEGVETEGVHLREPVVEGATARRDEAELHGDEVPAEELPGACVASSSRSSTLPNM